MSHVHHPHLPDHSDRVDTLRTGRPKNCIFLDIDGPLYNTRSRYLGTDMDQVAIRAIDKACIHSGAKIVISSQRRLNHDIFALFRGQDRDLMAHAAPQHVTPDLSQNTHWQLGFGSDDVALSAAVRRNEILTYCHTHSINVTDCLAIDDLQLTNEHFTIPQLLIDPDNGMTMEQVWQLEEWVARVAAANR